jgi:hypothetical protein
MNAVRLVGACLAAGLLALSGQTGAQGLLPMQPPAVDDMMSPYPLGPLQKFEDGFLAGQGRLARPEQASVPRPPQAHAPRMGLGQAARRRNPVSEPRQIVMRSAARQHESQRGTIGSESVLSLAPRTRERAPSRRFCFPASTIHLQQGERDVCNASAPAVKGRFEELLGE